MKKEIIKQIVIELAKEEESMMWFPHSCEAIANEAYIYWKFFDIWERQGKDTAFGYFCSTHNGDEYKEILSETTK